MGAIGCCVESDAHSMEGCIIDISRSIARTAYEIYEKNLMNRVKRGSVPRHLAIIMDGNRRFAQAMGLLPIEGHEKGAKTLESFLDWFQGIGIRILTVYAFSTENINRKPEEVDGLMRLFEEKFREVGDDERVHEHKIRVKLIGRKEGLPQGVLDAAQYAENRTRSYTNFLLNIAVNYGGREEMIDGIKRLCLDVKEERISVSDIEEELFLSYLYTNGTPDPDLVIRTSGEKRVSNFLLWQTAHSHFYFTDVYWPDLRKTDILRAIRSYQQRADGEEWTRTVTE